MARTRSKTQGANLTVPQNREQAAATVARIGALNRELVRIETEMNDVIADAKKAAEGRSAPLQDDIAAATEGLKMWAEANRSELTNQFTVKTVDIGTGTLSWRVAPPAVSGVPRKKELLAEMIKKIKSAGLKQFLRTTEEINKEAMLADPVKAQLVPGITVKSKGEEFTVEPFEVTLSAGGAA